MGGERGLTEAVLERVRGGLEDVVVEAPVVAVVTVLGGLLTVRRVFAVVFAVVVARGVGGLGARWRFGGRRSDANGGRGWVFEGGHG